MKIKNLPALLIGRFQPFHLGHRDVIQQILRRHKKVIIGIGSAQYKNLPENPYSAALRKRMIESSLRAARISKQKFTIVKIQDIHDDNLWVTRVEKLTPKFGSVWSGTPKVQKLFRKDGKHKVVTPKFNLKISGTKIRKRMRLGKPWGHMVTREVRKLLINN